MSFKGANMGFRIRFIVGILAIAFASSNCMQEEQQARRLAEEQVQKRKNNIKAMFEKFDEPILQSQLPLLESKEVVSLSEEQAQFVRGRDTLISLLDALEKISDPSVLESVGGALRRTIVLGFKKGLNVELIQKLLPIMSDWQSNKWLFPYLRRNRYKKVLLLNNDGEEIEEELESVRLERLLEIKRAIVKTFTLWNDFMIQDTIKLPVPNSREVLQLDEPQQQFVGPRFYLLRLLRGKKENAQQVSAQELRRQHELLEGLVDLGCREGLSARVIEGLLRIGALQEGNKRLFAGLVRYGSHETTQGAVTEEGPVQELSEAVDHVREARASGYEQKKE